MTKNREIAVIGAGLMGHGIALIFARAGYHVYITDLTEEVLNTVKDRVADSLRLMGVDELEQDWVLGKIRPAADLRTAVAGAKVVFEAAPEKLELKQSIFAQLEENAPDDAILASNTSVIQISKIMAGLKTATVRWAPIGGTHPT